MGIEDVAEEILREAEKKARQIEEEGNRERDRILAQAREHNERAKERMKREAEEANERLSHAALLQARKTVKDEALKAKADLMGLAYDTFFGKHRHELLQSLVAFCRQHGNADALYASTSDVAEVKKLFGGPVHAKQMKGGVVAQYGSDYLDLSIETIEDIMKSRTQKDVQKILFGKKKRA